MQHCAVDFFYNLICRKFASKFIFYETKNAEREKPSDHCQKKHFFVEKNKIKNGRENNIKKTVSKNTSRCSRADQKTARSGTHIIFKKIKIKLPVI